MIRVALLIPRVVIAVGAVAVIVIVALPLWWLDTDAYRAFKKEKGIQ